MKLLSNSQSHIVSLLKAKGVLSVNELTSALGTAKTAVRRNLLSLERRDLVERVYKPAKRGRPSLAFRLTSAANKLFPSKEAELLSSLLDFLIGFGHEKIVNEFFESYWQKRYDEIQKQLQKKGKDDLQTRLSVLKAVLEKEGFMPQSRFAQKGSQLSLQECHCPLEAAATVTSMPCKLEQRLISRVLNAPVKATTLRGEAQNACEFILPVSRQTKKDRL